MICRADDALSPDVFAERACKPNQKIYDPFAAQPNIASRSRLIAQGNVKCAVDASAYANDKH